MKIKLLITLLALAVLWAAAPAQATHDVPPGANPECFEHDGSTVSPKEARKNIKQIKQRPGKLSKADKQRIKFLRGQITEWKECKAWYEAHPA